MAIVSATRVRVRSLLFLPGFLLASGRASRQAASAPGFRRGQLVVDHGRTFWTVTLWDDAASMEAFHGADAQEAVPGMTLWYDEAATARWEQGSDALPDPDELGQRMVAAARFVELPNASRAHAAGSGPMPPRPYTIQAIKRR
jgi:heme-degrading monooxygenase HmoA